MQIIENWSHIKGMVRSLHPSPAVRGFIEVEVQVEKVSPVEEYANLLAEAEGKSLALLVPEELVTALDIRPGDGIESRVRRANLDRSFVHRNYISVHHTR